MHRSEPAPRLRLMATRRRVRTPFLATNHSSRAKVISRIYIIMSGKGKGGKGTSSFASVCTIRLVTVVRLVHLLVYTIVLYNRVY